MLISSHLLAEVEQTVDDVVIIARGRLRFQARSTPSARAPDTVEVRTTRSADLEALFFELTTETEIAV